MTPFTNAGQAAAAEGLTDQAVWGSLHTASPASADNELVGGDYARAGIAVADWSTTVNRRENDVAVTFPLCTDDWLLPQYVGLWTAAVGGVLLTYGRIHPFPTTAPVTNQLVSFPAGAIMVGITPPWPLGLAGRAVVAGVTARMAVTVALPSPVSVAGRTVIAGVMARMAVSVAEVLSPVSIAGRAVIAGVTARMAVAVSELVAQAQACAASDILSTNVSVARRVVWKWDIAVSGFPYWLYQGGTVGGDLRTLRLRDGTCRVVLDGSTDLLSAWETNPLAFKVSAAGQPDLYVGGPADVSNITVDTAGVSYDFEPPTAKKTEIGDWVVAWVAAGEPAPTICFQAPESAVSMSAPVWASVPNISASVGDADEPVNLGTYASSGWPDADLTFSASSNNAGTAAVSVAGSTLTVDHGASGTATITVTATDPDGLESTQSFTVNVAAAISPVSIRGRAVIAGVTARADLSVTPPGTTALSGRAVVAGVTARMAVSVAAPSPVSLAGRAIVAGVAGRMAVTVAAPAGTTLSLPQSALTANDFNRLVWQDGTNGLGRVDDLVVGGGVSHLVSLWVHSGSDSQVTVRDVLTGSLSSSGPDLIPAWETFATAIVLHNDHISTDVVLPGPNNSGNTQQDNSNPYSWRPSPASQSEIGTWITAFRLLTTEQQDDTTVTLRAA